MKRRLLVVGCGSIGRRHLRNLAELSAGELLAFDPDPERRRQASVESDAEPVDDLSSALASGVEAVLICSPTALHGKQAMRACEHAHLFIEKPLANTYAEAAAVAEAVQVHRRICLVACNMRFHPGITALREALTAGEIGRPLSARAEFGHHLPDWHPSEDYRLGYSARRDLGGGVIRDVIHEIDLLRFLFGDLEQAQGLCGRVGNLEIDTEDIAVLVGRTTQGVWCELHLDYLQRSYSRSLKIIGTEGTLMWDMGAKTTTLQHRDGDTRVLSDFSTIDPNTMYLDEMRHFLRCLERSEVPAQDVEAGAAAVRVVEMFREI